jgi:hypothetical protein
MGSNNQSTTEFEKLKEALFGISGFKPDPPISHSLAIATVLTTSRPGPITHIHNPIDKESILLNKETFDKYIFNCVDIIKKKKEPFFTLVKNNLKTVFFSTDVEVDDVYKTKMRERLQLILNKTYYNKNEVLEEVVWIIDEYITESGYALSKEILVWLNEQYKKD